jgi:tetratricopeptide (TPR) repeat protein
MTRFRTLEFDEEEPTRISAHDQARATVAREVRDESYHVREAEREYQNARFEQALRLYSRALEANPNLDAAWVGQVRMLIEMGELKEATVWADRALELFKDHAELLSAKGVVAARLGDRKKALQFSDSAASAKGAGSVYAWLARGEVLLATRRDNGAFCLEKAKGAAGKPDWFTVLLVARIFYFYRHYARGLQNAREAAELQPTAPFAWLVVGNCQEALGLVSRARESYGEAVKLDRDFQPAREALHGVSSLGVLKRMDAALRRVFH